MTETSILTLLQRIDRALLAEIEIVRDGRFAELRDVQRETLAAMEALDGARAGASLAELDRGRVNMAIAGVSARAEQARGLIGAALHGARNARARIDALVQREGDVGAYDRTGGQIRMKPHGSPYRRTL
ncbi:MAG: hypothetical protein AAF311_02780 [Pseudomonadota bacterium]